MKKETSMFKKSKKENQKLGNEINITLPGGFFGALSLKLPSNKHKSSSTEGAKSPSNKNYRCEVWDCEISKLVCLLGDIATNLWRARNRREANGLAAVSNEIKKMLRHYEATWDIITNAGFEICDHTNEAYPEGSSLKVIAFQPMAGYGSLTVAETVKPTIYFKGKKIQEGEVIVAMPVKEDATGINKE